MNKKAGCVLCMILMVGSIFYIYYATHSVSQEKEVKGPVRCGVDLPSCSGEHVRCINGYCRSDIITTFH